ncbi:MAG: BON domain-containing protein [Pseudorhodobacter sp.]|nr:BON domain-containing protein [Pseudorhodobacter sp.]
MANSRYDDRGFYRTEQDGSNRSQRGWDRDDQDQGSWQHEPRGPQRQSDWSPEAQPRGYQEARDPQGGYGIPPRGDNMRPQRARYPEDPFVAGFGYGGGMASGGLGYGAGVSGTRDWRATDYSRDHDRGMMSRAGDEIASWFGDEAAARRREEDHRGKGPRGYQRSDDRIREDVSDRLSDDPRIDASDVEVLVESSEVTLAGEVASKAAKRCAEDCADAVSGVTHVQNNLRVKRTGSDVTGNPGTQI